MITKITGEQPFQVLTSNFSISPSQEGYTLQISADGRQYSNLFTVGAGVTRLVTGVAANSYYRLSGNQSQVSINWVKTCVTEGGGASGTELSPVSEFPLDAEAGTVVAYNGTASASGVYQYTGEEWVAVGVDDLSAYWTSAQTQSAITAVEDHLFDVEEVTASALTELHEDVLEISARTTDLSGYWTSAETQDAIDEAISGFTPGGNYVERAESESTLIIPTNINDNENDAYIGTFEDGFAYRFPINNERLSNIHNTQIDEDGNVTGHRFENEEYVVKGDLNWFTQSLKAVVLDGPQSDNMPEDPGTVVPTMKYDGIYWNKTNGYSEYYPRDISLRFDSGVTFINAADPTDEEDILDKAEKIGDINYIAGWNGAENVLIYNEIYGFVDNNTGDNYVAVKTRYCDANGTEIASGFTAMMVEDGAEEWHAFDVGDGYEYGIYFNVHEDSENNRLEVVFAPTENSSQYEGEDFFEGYRMEANTNQPTDASNSYFNGLKYFDPESGGWENINKPVQDQIDTLNEVVSVEVMSAISTTQQVAAAGLNQLEARINELSAATPSVDLSGYYTSAQTENAITSKNYVTSAQVETQIVEKNYITSAATADMVTSTSVSTIWRGNQAQYDAIVNKDPNTFYIIVNN